jgi:hypothetical protein
MEVMMKSFKPEKSARGDREENCSRQTRTYDVIFNRGSIEVQIQFEASIPTIYVRDFLRACFSLEDVRKLMEGVMTLEQLILHFRQHGFIRIET